jgi:hypothetical protein
MKKSPDSIGRAFNAASSAAPRPTPARREVPEAIRRHKPVMTGPKPPGSVSSAVHRNVREQQAAERARQAKAQAPRQAPPKLSRREEFNTRAKQGVATQQFNRASRGKR